MAIGEVAFRHDQEWIAALNALRDDPDAPLPGLPGAEEDAATGDDAAAGAA